MGTTGNLQQKWAVHKFGGTSVLNSDRYRGVIRILAEERARQPHLRQAVVVSAMKGVTDDLIHVAQLACHKDASYVQKLEQIKKRHMDAAQELGITAVQAVFEKDFQELSEVLRGLWLTQTVSDRNVEFISGFGEVWSAQILAATLEAHKVPSRYLDARQVLVVDSFPKSVAVQWDDSQKKLDTWMAQNEVAANGATLAITGFVASTRDGAATTLKRNGSDFSGSIFGALLDAAEITIWTDVDGVLSADPRFVPDAIVLHEMTYHEVTELAHFGAKVVHPATMEPAVRKKIPVWVRNTMNPGFAGTKIHNDAKSESAIKGVSAIEKMALINIEGRGMVGVIGIAERLFGALRSAQVSAVMISQASSEHSISIAVAEEHAALAVQAIEKEFYAEIHQGALDRIEAMPGKSILAIVGDNMVNHPGIAGRFFSALGKAGVNIHAIAQGASERNISAVIDSASTKLGLRTVHTAFYLSPQTVGIGLIGTGLIGKEFLRQLQEHAPELKKNHGIDVRVLATMNSREMKLGDAGAIAPDYKRFTQHLKAASLPHSVIIDATANGEIAQHYPEWMRDGFHIVTPNKKANSSTMAFYKELRAAMSQANRQFLYSTNVCAGLPVLRTLRDLRLTGDKLERVEGILSGTLSYLFNLYDGTKPFSALVQDAKAKGLTEPDPREDLSGQDVARKLVVLAREAGLEIELDDIQIESLVGINDDEFKKRHETARAQNKVLRYVGRIEPRTAAKGVASVALTAVDTNHPMAQLRGADNLVAFTTDRYKERPLVIQGPGAGAQVTAGGVFADVLRIVGDTQ